MMDEYAASKDNEGSFLPINGSIASIYGYSNDQITFTGPYKEIFT